MAFDFIITFDKKPEGLEKKLELEGFKIAGEHPNPDFLHYEHTNPLSNFHDVEIDAFPASPGYSSSEYPGEGWHEEGSKTVFRYEREESNEHILEGKYFVRVGKVGGNVLNRLGAMVRLVNELGKGARRVLINDYDSKYDHLSGLEGYVGQEPYPTLEDIHSIILGGISKTETKDKPKADNKKSKLEIYLPHDNRTPLFKKEGVVLIKDSEIHKHFGGQKLYEYSSEDTEGDTFIRVIHDIGLLRDIPTLSYRPYARLVFELDPVRSKHEFKTFIAKVIAFADHYHVPVFNADTKEMVRMAK